MSTLLYNERPMVFSPTLAKVLGGINRAIVLQQLHYWMQKSENEIDGRKWVYDTYEKWSERLGGCLTPCEVRGAFDHLVSIGVVVVRKGVRHKFDRTNWYSIDHTRLSSDGATDAEHPYSTDLLPDADGSAAARECNSVPAQIEARPDAVLIQEITTVDNTVEETPPTPSKMSRKKQKLLAGYTEQEVGWGTKLAEFRTEYVKLTRTETSIVQFYADTMRHLLKSSSAEDLDLYVEWLTTAEDGRYLFCQRGGINTARSYQGPLIRNFASYIVQARNWKAGKQAAGFPQQRKVDNFAGVNYDAL